MYTLTNEPDATQLLAASVSATDRLLIVAGPGTGKTQVSALRLAHLVSTGLLPSQILVLSFSRSAVRTLMRRIGSLVQVDGSVVEDLRHISVRTFDSWAFRLLRLSGLQPDQLMRNTYEGNIAALVQLMSDDLTDQVRDLLKGIRHIIIDESQDIGGVRLQLVKALVTLLAPPGRPGVGFTILGDNAQAIYQFAARAEGMEASNDTNCMQFARESYPKEVREIELIRNYRATPEIAASTGALRKLFSKEIDSGERLRRMEDFVASLPAGCAGHLDDTWLSTIPTGSIAILTRTNGEALRVAKELSGRQTLAPVVPISLHLSGYNAPVPPWIAALLGPVKGDTITRVQFGRIHAHALKTLGEQERLSISLPSEVNSWLRLVRACGLSDEANAFSLDLLRNRVCWPDAFPDDQLPAESTVQISTIHQSKGMEYDCVFLLEPESEDRPVEEEDVMEPDAEEDAKPGTDPDEEASVLFVGVTRAARHLGTIPRGAIYKPFNGKSFNGGSRRRLMNWWNKWVNIEVGISGDINPLSFVDTALHGSSDEVATMQSMLVGRAAELRGHKVMLCKSVNETTEGAVTVLYRIHLQDGNMPGLLIGETTSQLTFDLLSLLKAKYSLPSRIMNLRICNVITVPGTVELPVGIPQPYRTSRLWLGISLSGTGDFMPFKKGVKKA